MWDKKQDKDSWNMIDDIERVDAIKLDDVNNKHLKSWFGKSLSLSINCYDMGT